MTRTCRATGEALVVPGRNLWSKVDSITVTAGSESKDARVAEGFVVAMIRSNVREQRDPAVNNLPTTLGGRDEMINASISLQDLRRKIYLKAKSDKTWRNAVASAGTGGVGLGFTRLWDYLMITESDIT